MTLCRSCAVLNHPTPQYDEWELPKEEAELAAWTDPPARQCKTRGTPLPPGTVDIPGKEADNYYDYYKVITASLQQHRICTVQSGHSQTACHRARLLTLLLLLPPTVQDDSGYYGEEDSEEYFNESDAEEDDDDPDYFSEKQAYISSAATPQGNKSVRPTGLRVKVSVTLYTQAVAQPVCTRCVRFGGKVHTFRAGQVQT